MRYDDGSNLAYDLSLFDTDDELEKRRKKREEQNKQKAAAEIKMTEKTSVGRNGSVIAAFALITFAGVVAFSWLYNKVQISDYISLISETKNEIEQTERDNIRLHSELDSMYTLDNVEQMASDELGLQKTQSSQITYITLNTENMTEVAEEEHNIFVSIQNWFNDILEYLGFKS